MRNKGICLIFLLVIAMLMFSGCARYDGTYDQYRTNNVTDNGTNYNPNNGTGTNNGLTNPGVNNRNGVNNYTTMPNNTTNRNLNNTNQ